MPDTHRPFVCHRLGQHLHALVHGVRVVPAFQRISLGVCRRVVGLELWLAVVVGGKYAAVQRAREERLRALHCVEAAEATGACGDDEAF